MIKTGYQCILGLLLLAIASQVSAVSNDIFRLMRLAETAPVLDQVRQLDDLSVRDHKARTLLMQAARFKHVDVVRYLLKQEADVNAVDADGDSALKYAAWTDSTEIIGLLLAHGADLEQKSRLGTTPLWPAVISGREKVVKYLLDKGADSNVPNQYGMSPLRFARSRDEWALAELLKQYGGKDF